MDKRIFWLSNMTVGYEPLDNEHKSFIEIINDAYVLLAQKNLNAFGDIFLKIDAYMERHFVHEEMIMRQIVFPDVMSHVESHQKFAVHINELKKEFLDAKKDPQKERVAAQTADFIKAWFLGHTLSRDKIYKPYLVRLNKK
ncbi:MAG: bacteriohemerythrin [Alphaproteobacteria bacterium]|nr:bacteriohemerythrin [Alphaproteobacteria bacterium]